MSDTTRLKESRNQVHYLRLEKFALQARVKEMNVELEETKDNLEWRVKISEKLATDFGYIEDLWIASQQQVTALREALDKLKVEIAYDSTKLGYINHRHEGMWVVDVDIVQEGIEQIEAALATPAPASETEEGRVGGPCGISGCGCHLSPSNTPTNEPLETGTV